MFAYLRHVAAFAVVTSLGTSALAGPTLYDVVNACNVITVSGTPGFSVQLPVGDPTALVETDDGRNVDLDVLVLLDGVTEAHAASIFAEVSLPYAPLGITVVPTYQVVSPGFVSTDGFDLMGEAKRLFPNQRVPAEYDMVEVLTSKNIRLGDGPLANAVAGVAYCLGGAYDDRYAFEVSEARDTTAGGIRTAAKITAHEMAHLFGGQHEYANCVETATTPGDGECTLMINDVGLARLQFSTLNGRIVRGYALRYATANDV